MNKENMEECTEKCTEKVNSLFGLAIKTYLGTDESGASLTWWVYAAFTDCLMLDVWTPDCERQVEIVKQAELLLELRVFSTVAEYRLIRGNIGSDLKRRVKATDIDLTKDVDYYDEWQFLDINTKKVDFEKHPGKCLTETTGGGKYLIPFSKQEFDDLGENAGVNIRNYLSYYVETGQAYVSDWRILKLGRVENG